MDMRKAAGKKFKGVTRIDEPERHGVGWYARVTLNRRTQSKYFSDGRHGGKQRALQKAISWRDDKEKELGIPRTERIIPPVSSRSRTGVSGVYRAGNHYVVAWCPATGVVVRKFISIPRYGEQSAFLKAVELRRQKERSVYGKSLSARGQGRGVKALPKRKTRKKAATSRRATSKRKTAKRSPARGRR
jgi:hypothetical protein